MIQDKLYIKCVEAAARLISRGYLLGGVSVDVLAETMYKMEIEKNEKNALSDSTIDYNDEILSIDDVGEVETIDISVTGDNLFYCNGILTKNSFGLPATADVMLALISTEELEEQGQIMVKQLKNRYNDISRNRKFTVGIDRSRMKILDVGSPVVGDEGFGKKDEDPVKPKFSKDRDSDGSDRYSDWSFD